MNYLRSLFLLGFIFTTLNAQSQELTNEEKHSVDSLFSTWAKTSSPGCAVAIINKGEIAYAQGYGMANLEYNIPITTQTPFHVASVSKQFTNFAILLLEENGHLSIDDDIRTYLPEIHDFGHKITIRHLMNHTSGFRDQWELLAISGWRLDDVITKDHIMKMILGQRELNFLPGEEYMYSNAGYSMLARIVDKVSGKIYRDYARDTIFSPLKMMDTHVHDDHERIVPGRAYSYYNNGDGFKKSVLSYANDGATSLFTTAEDLTRWIGNMLNPNLGESFISKMHKPGILNKGDTLDYALGLGVGEYKGIKFAGHGGSDAGFRSNIRWYPEKEVGVVVLSNLASFNASQMVNKITDIILKEDLAVDPETVEKKEEPTFIEMSEDQLKAFEGKYTISDLGVSFNIKLDEGKLLLAQEWDNSSYNILPVADNKFIVQNNIGLTFEFSKQNDNYIEIKILQGPNTFTAKRFNELSFDDNYYDKFLGSYLNDETQAVYHMVWNGDGLKATHMRHNDIPLTTLEENNFRGSTWWFGKVEFTTNDSGNVDGFFLTGGRVRNLKFKKIMN